MGVANRIEKLASDMRDRQRRIDGYSHNFGGGYIETTPPAEGAFRERLTAQLIALADQHAYWEAVRAEQIAPGKTSGHSRATIKKGDKVKIRGQRISSGPDEAKPGRCGSTAGRSAGRR